MLFGLLHERHLDSYHYHNNQSYVPFVLCLFLTFLWLLQTDYKFTEHIPKLKEKYFSEWILLNQYFNMLPFWPIFETNSYSRFYLVATGEKDKSLARKSKYNLIRFRLPYLKILTVSFSEDWQNRSLILLACIIFQLSNYGSELEIITNNNVTENTTVSLVFAGSVIRTSWVLYLPNVN